MDIKDENDIISNLPQDIIGEILSFLPIEEAVRTSVLSRLWKYNWTAINDVHLDSKFLLWDPKFIEFLENLFRAIGYSQLRKFYFYSDFGETETGQFRHILTILRHNLEELKLSVRITLKLSPLYPLSKLRILDLQRIKIVSDESSSFVLHCPSLKSLTLVNCEWIQFTKIAIDSPLLEAIHIEDCNYNNETSTASESGFCVFKVFAPHLNKFLYTGAFYEEFILSNPSSVSESMIEFTTWTGLNPHRYNSGAKLLASFSNLKFLKLRIN